MNTNETAAYRTSLEAEKMKLEQELAGVGRRNPANPADWEPTPPPDIAPEADPIDIAGISTSFDTNASIVADLETRYNQVLAALVKIEEGTYGICKVCSKVIEVKRLAADPAALTCVEHMNN